MNPDIAREIRENIARARLLIRRGEFAPALRLLAAALELNAGLKSFGSMRYEIEVAFGEAFADLNVQPAMQPLLTPPGGDKPVSLKHIRGKDKALATLFANLVRRLEAEADKRTLEQMKEREARKRDLLARARAQFAEGELPKGRAFIQKIIEEFGDEDARLHIHTAELLRDVSMPLDAADILRDAIDKFPKDPKLYTLLIDSYERAKEYSKAEDIYARAFRQFGTHPHMAFRLARLYVNWKHYKDAERVLAQLLREDPDFEQARKLLELVRKRLDSESQ